MKNESIVRFENPINDNEKKALMVVLEVRDTRALVSDLRFSQWSIPPTDVYAMSDLEVVPEYQIETPQIYQKTILDSN